MVSSGRADAVTTLPVFLVLQGNYADFQLSVPENPHRVLSVAARAAVHAEQLPCS